ncbi:hypothetical protein [Flagellimonas meishanensis]|uniref:hypothetical protein n=1 Tax=Flagellimonas meishanensis TaxID=2873264 RepID=UPI001CA76382|nr:hypothetical protein [[Muricauda] meishanensis]
MKKASPLFFCLYFVCFVGYTQSNLFFNPSEASTIDEVQIGPNRVEITPADFDPNNIISFDKKMGFSAQNSSGWETSSEFLVNTEKGYMGMDNDMLERFTGTNLSNDNFKVEYRVTATNGKTYYFIEIEDEKYVMNRLPLNEISVDETNMSLKKFNQNFSDSGNQRNIGDQSFESKEYSSSNPDGSEAKVYISEQENVSLSPSNTPKTVGVFGLGYIYADNKTQIVTRVETSNGIGELQRIQNTNVSFNGNEYKKYEEKVAEEEEEKNETIEDVARQKRQNISEMPRQRADIANKELEILEVEESMQEKRKEAMNKYLEDGAPAERNAEYKLEGFDPKDMVNVQKLTCEKRILEINKSLDRMNPSNATYGRLQNEKNCLEGKIIDYKNAEMELEAIKNRNADDPHKGNVEKMNYFFTEVSQNIMARPCN